MDSWVKNNHLDYFSASCVVIYPTHYAYAIIIGRQFQQLKYKFNVLSSGRLSTSNIRSRNHFKYNPSPVSQSVSHLSIPIIHAYHHSSQHNGMLWTVSQASSASLSLILPLLWSVLCNHMISLFDQRFP